MDETRSELPDAVQQSLMRIHNARGPMGLPMMSIIEGHLLSFKLRKSADESNKAALHLWGLMVPAIARVAEAAVRPLIQAQYQNSWLPIPPTPTPGVAPFDGRPVLLLSRPHEAAFPDADGKVISFSARVAIGLWNPDGTSWVPGSAPKITMELKVTGVWESEGAWFEPGEVSHYQPLAPLPPPPAEGGR